MEAAAGGMAGHPPIVKVTPSEQRKYELAWSDPRYRHTVPGAHYVHLFIEHARPRDGDTLIDFGCGTGVGGWMLHKMAHLDVTLMDFAGNCLDQQIRDRLNDKLRFVQHDLSKWPYPVETAQWGFCTDVLEHLPESSVPDTLKNIVRAAQHVFFSIATVPDLASGWMGLDYPLHLTVRPYSWWKEAFESLHCKIHWSNEVEGAAMFFLSAYADAKDLCSRLQLNTTEQEARDHIIANLDLGLAEVCPHEEQPDREIILLGGGPSLEDFRRDIFQRAHAGMPVVTMNGSYKWALDNRILPAAQVVLDARNFNKRFCQPSIPNCKYLLCSQVDPELTRSLPPEQVVLWHSGNSASVREAVNDWCARNDKKREWYPVYGGSTVMLRALPLMRMLGFSKFHIYGFDSCCRNGKHHPYEQPENDGLLEFDVIVGGKRFRAHSSMLSQAKEFMDLVRAMADMCEIEVYGDGLIAHILHHAASLPIEGDAKRYYMAKEDS